MLKFVSNSIQAHIAAIDENIGKEKYLALKRSDNNQIYPSLWQVVTGSMSENETALETAKREVLEETGLIPQKIWSIPYVALFFNHKKNQIHASPVFGFLVNYEHQIILSEEHQNYKWLDYDALIDLLELPSHKEGTKIFRDFILNKTENELYRIL